MTTKIFAVLSIDPVINAVLALDTSKSYLLQIELVRSLTKVDPHRKDTIVSSDAHVRI